MKSNLDLPPESVYKTHRWYSDQVREAEQQRQIALNNPETVDDPKEEVYPSLAGAGKRLQNSRIQMNDHLKSARQYALNHQHVLESEARQEMAADLGPDPKPQS